MASVSLKLVLLISVCLLLGDASAQGRSIITMATFSLGLSHSRDPG